MAPTRCDVQKVSRSPSLAPSCPSGKGRPSSSSRKPFDRLPRLHPVEVYTQVLAACEQLLQPLSRKSLRVFGTHSRDTRRTDFSVPSGHRIVPVTTNQ